MKRMCLIAVMFAGLLASCADSIPFRDDPLKPDSLATREYPHAFFIIQGKTTDSISLEPVPGISVNLRTETPVFTEEGGSFPCKRPPSPFPRNSGSFLTLTENTTTRYTCRKPYTYILCPPSGSRRMRSWSTDLNFRKDLYDC